MMRMLVPGWGEVGPQDFASQWSHVSQLGPLAATFILYADGTTRLTAGNAQPSFDARTAFPSSPVQRAYSDSDLEEQFSEVSELAFAMELTVDRYAGSVIPLRMGKRPVFQHTNGIPSSTFLELLSEMPQLEEQGDGVKSFMGLMIQLIGGSQEIILVDEPEAFLHPPQARLLGRLLAERATDQQVFLASHSSAILQGVLEAGAPVTIIRLTREGDVNRAAVLDDAALKDLWADPLLRYSDVLEGLFYDAVVLCESDSDCRYYSAVRDNLALQVAGQRKIELLFVQCGGKARLSVVVNALRAVQVPVVVVADFDILRVEQDIRKTVVAAGGDWAQFAGNQDVLAKALGLEGKPMRKTPVLDALSEKISTFGEILTRENLESLRAILKLETGWDKAKRGGLSSVPQGAAYVAAQELVEQLKDQGILVVPVGELERFVPAVSGHGPSWVNEVLAQQLHEVPSPEAQAFVTLIEQCARARSGRPTLDVK